MLYEVESQESALVWFVRGALAVISIPALILMTAFIGFAGLARESGFDIYQTIFMSTMVWALPSLVVFAGSVAANASFLTIFIAVALSAVRLLPMTISLIPLIREQGKTKRWQLLIVSHFVAVTAWVFAMYSLPHLPRPARIPYFLGFAITLKTCVITVCAIAFFIAGFVPPLIAAGLFLLTPIYFMLALWSAGRQNLDKLALIFGLIIGTAVYPFFPEFDLLISGLVGGTLAFLITKFKKRAM